MSLAPSLKWMGKGGEAKEEEEKGGVGGGGEGEGNDKKMGENTQTSVRGSAGIVEKHKQRHKQEKMQK